MGARAPGRDREEPARRRVRVGLRLNPPWGIAEKRVIIGGPGAKKFGFDIRTAGKILRMKERFPHLDICGFQVFNASNVLDAALLVENTRSVLTLALSPFQEIFGPSSLRRFRRWLRRSLCGRPKSPWI